MKIGIPVYKGVNLLDVAGPMEMFFWAAQEVAPERSLETILISEDGGGVASINGVRFEVDTSFPNSPPIDVLWVPGGDPKSLETLMSTRETPYLQFLSEAARNARWVCSVCEGALLLARAGLLDGHKATTHWAFVDCLRRFTAIEVDDKRERFVVSGNRLTGGGISAGLDEALKLIVLLYGERLAEAVQATTQYFPQPPVMAQLPRKAPTCSVRWPDDHP